MVADDEAPEAIAIGTDERHTPPPGRKPVPVTLITGFLGAGKTTLVRYILSAPHGLRIAVILNEFGEGVENSYFQDIEGLRDSNGEWVELDNGCMCCSVKSEFVQALEALLAKERRPDYILIETTGLANPGPVAAALWTDEDVEAGVQLDSIITVVDAINIDRQLNAVRADSTVNEAQVQVAYADLILLNKMDLCQEEAVARAEADIRAINSSVHILHTTKCTVDLNMLLNRNGYKLGQEVALEPIAEGEDDEGEGEGEDGRPSQVDLEVVGTSIPTPASGQLTAQSVQQVQAQQGPGSGPQLLSSTSRVSLARSSVGSSHSRAVSLTLEPLGGTDEDHATHDPHIQTVTLSTDQPLVLEKFKSFMDKLLWDRETHPEDIYRVKGVLSVEGEDRKHMVQAVYELYNISPSAAWLPNERRQSRVVVIGRQLNRTVLNQLFAAAQ